jgi:uncharacterized repeat protein (TIGR01451 family)
VLIDGGAWEPCVSPRSYTFPPGSHHFETRATDPGGTTDPTPAQASLTVPAPAVGGSAPPAPPAAPVVPPPDLGVSLAATPRPIQVGKTITYVATVTNHGLAAASAAVTFSLPAHTRFVSSPGCSPSGHNVACRLDALLPGAVTQVRVRVIPQSPATLVCSVNVSSEPSDAAPRDNAASLTLRVRETQRTGTARADTLIGTAGDDVLRGLAGNDKLDGRAGRDHLYVGNGNDRLTGGVGADTVFGGPGRDSVDCGPGRDTVFADRVDPAPRHCEIVRRR